MTSFKLIIKTFSKHTWRIICLNKRDNSTSDHVIVYPNFFQNAVGYDDRTELSKHNSQTDGAKGFGGKFGVDKTNQDKVHNYYSLVGKTRF